MIDRADTSPVEEGRVGKRVNSHRQNIRAYGMVMMLGPPVGSCEYGNRNLVPNIRKLTLAGDTVDQPRRLMRGLKRLSWDFYMAPSTNRSGREPFKLVMLGSNPAGVTINVPQAFSVEAMPFVIQQKCQRKHGFASSTTPGGWRKKTSNDMEQYKRFRQTLK